jgi:hypothetical protein
MDIPAGVTEELDIAVRCDDDVEAYGFNNDSYAPQYLWRNAQWRLPQGSFIAEVIIRSSGETVSERFLINNDLSRDEFRIEGVPK